MRGVSVVYSRTFFREATQEVNIADTACRRFLIRDIAGFGLSVYRGRRGAHF